ncbi:hypothetical protein DFH09DRAFT_1087712 [Mycena vulgaris]|nr:hypothetical protein DFH09DRAFT_1087712 [Mycena vulgaris]
MGKSGTNTYKCSNSPRHSDNFGLRMFEALKRHGTMLPARTLLPDPLPDWPDSPPSEPVVEEGEAGEYSVSLALQLRGGGPKKKRCVPAQKTAQKTEGRVSDGKHVTAPAKNVKKAESYQAVREKRGPRQEYWS